jgi:hypothetical protein
MAQTEAGPKVSFQAPFSTPARATPIAFWPFGDAARSLRSATLGLTHWRNRPGLSAPSAFRDIGQQLEKREKLVA